MGLLGVSIGLLGVSMGSNVSLWGCKVSLWDRICLYGVDCVSKSCCCILGCSSSERTTLNLKSLRVPEILRSNCFLFRPKNQSSWPQLRSSTTKKYVPTVSSVIGYQCDQIWRNFAAFANNLKVLGNCLRLYLVFGHILFLSLFWQIFIEFGQCDKTLK